jgi:hypothetical protein
MAIQLSEEVRNARLDAIEVTTGASAKLKIRSGAAPANCAAAESGTVLGTFDLPSDWMAAAASGAKAKSGTWEETAADAGGTAEHFRLYKTDGSTCVLQGTVGQGSGDLSLDNTTIVLGQTITVTAFTLTDGNA